MNTTSERDTDMSVTDAAEAELVDAQARVESAKAGYDQALAVRAARPDRTAHPGPKETLKASLARCKAGA